MFSFTNLFLVTCASSVTIASSLRARANNENVVLADCTGPQNTGDLASEVAYFTGAPDGSPDDISVVTTGSHQSWANRTTSALFSDTGVTFTAVLRESGEAGDYAGTGNNGYGNFTCWQMTSTYLYSHNSRNCFAVYDCNHLGAPVSLPSASASASTTPTASTSSSATASSTPVASSGLSVGAIVGLSVGVAVGVLILVGIAALLVWRHWRSNRQARAAAEFKGKGPHSRLPEMPKPMNPIWQGPGARELETPQVYHELPNDCHPVEAHGDAIRGELDGTPPRVELHSHDLPPRYENETGVSPGAYGNFKGPI
ncbi:hypothetical protein F4820DRAFT_166752 [Hypoxylon rubiginosum]|uniref:Uncharacterized protein n=1 Tax=Hypoxylon rubiginosum TaxID=110542 RepID=A0ACB9YJR2_9PEZI|nr:hypothetical protein F4820DRAFT_166752 [Hypoxylon rubiginosum]